MVLLDNDKFLIQLAKMFQRGRVSGCVTLTVKQYDGLNTSTPKEKTDTSAPIKYKCLIRASSKNKKLATVVDKEDVVKFQTAYAQLLRANLDGLKKIKKQKVKAKATQ